MNARGTIVYVHGASDRSAQVSDHVARIEAQLTLARMPFDVVASRWGEAVGARLDDIELALPPTEELARAALTDTPASREARLAHPLAELDALGRMADVGDQPSFPHHVGRRDADKLLDVCRSEAVGPNDVVPLTTGEEVPMSVACRNAASAVGASPEYARARDSAAPEPILVGAVGRAVAATVAASADASTDVERIVELRIAEAVVGAALATLVVGYLGVDLGPDVRRWATDILVPHRAQLMRDAGLGVADILLYQRNGGPIRRFVNDSIEEALGRGRPVIALGNSLGGVILVDALSEDGPAQPDLLVTVGSQAPVLATFGALGPGAALGGNPFQPWLNIFDRRDLLGFVAGRVWPDEPAITDREVDLGVGFPDSHGAAYLGHGPVYEAIREHAALRSLPTDHGARRFAIAVRRWPVVLGWLFRARPGNSYVETDDHLEAHLGRLDVRTPIANVASVRVEQARRPVTTLGFVGGLFKGELTIGAGDAAHIAIDLRAPLRWLLFSVRTLHIAIDDGDAFVAAVNSLIQIRTMLIQGDSR